MTFVQVQLSVQEVEVEVEEGLTVADLQDMVDGEDESLDVELEILGT